MLATYLSFLLITVYSPTEGHFGCFTVLSIMNKLARIIHIVGFNVDIRF